MKKILGAMKAELTTKGITFNPSSTGTGETLYIHVAKLSVHEVLVLVLVGFAFLHRPLWRGGKPLSHTECHRCWSHRWS